jgi:hypothetical protein
MRKVLGRINSKRNKIVYTKILKITSILKGS